MLKIFFFSFFQRQVNGVRSAGCMDDVRVPASSKSSMGMQKAESAAVRT
jgi:hypothetical protein